MFAGLGSAATTSRIASIATILVWLAALAVGSAPLYAQDLPLPRESELALIESLYREGDAYRAESEMLRLLHFHPRHPDRPAVELARAKLYYREGRYREADLMVFSLLDRHPRSPVDLPARRLLTFSQLRQGNYSQARRWLPALRPSGRPPPSLAAFGDIPPGGADPEHAETWSAWLPGSGFFVSGQPGKAATAMGLNLVFLGAAAIFAQDGNNGAALLFLLLEGMLYQGGRDGARQDAVALNRRLRERQTTRWLLQQGEGNLLRIGIETRFGGG